MTDARLIRMRARLSPQEQARLDAKLAREDISSPGIQFELDVLSAVRTEVLGQVNLDYQHAPEHSRKDVDIFLHGLDIGIECHATSRSLGGRPPPLRVPAVLDEAGMAEFEAQLEEREPDFRYSSTGFVDEETRSLFVVANSKATDKDLARSSSPILLLLRGWLTIDYAAAGGIDQAYAKMARGFLCLRSQATAPDGKANALHETNHVHVLVNEAANRSDLRMLSSFDEAALSSLVHEVFDPSLLRLRL